MSNEVGARRKLETRARRLGVVRPDLLTLDELESEIGRLAAAEEPRPERPRGWLAVARDLIASVVEQGLHLPDAAALLRGDTRPLERKPIAPVPTVTLAEIYAAQGHLARALSTVEEVLAREPEHEAALRLRRRLRESLAEKEARQGRRPSEPLREPFPPADPVTAPAEPGPVPAGGALPEADVPRSQALDPAPSRAADEQRAAEVPRLHLIVISERELGVSWELGELGFAGARLELVQFEVGPRGARRHRATAPIEAGAGARRFERCGVGFSRARIVAASSGRSLVVAAQELARAPAGDAAAARAFERVRALG